MPLTVITFGTFDCFHIGHLNIFKNAKDQYPDSKLIVGVSSDELNYSKKQRYPVVSLEQRMEIISSIRYVDGVFVEESLDMKREYLLLYEADILVMGSDHEGLFDHLSDICEVNYYPRTPQISTTAIIEKVVTGQPVENNDGDS